MADVINGSDLIVFIDVEGTPTPIAHGTSYTLTRTMATRRTTNKGSGQIEERGKGRMDVTASSSHLMVYGDFEDLYNAHLNGDEVTLSFGAPDTEGDLDPSLTYAEGVFLISSIDENANDGENASFTVSFELSGDFEFVD